MISRTQILNIIGTEPPANSLNYGPTPAQRLANAFGGSAATWARAVDYYHGTSGTPSFALGNAQAVLRDFERILGARRAGVPRAQAQGPAPTDPRVADIEDRLERARLADLRTEISRMRVAKHEAGHAVCALALGGTVHRLWAGDTEGLCEYSFAQMPPPAHKRAICTMGGTAGTGTGFYTDPCAEWDRQSLMAALRAAFEQADRERPGGEYRVRTEVSDEQLERWASGSYEDAQDIISERWQFFSACARRLADVGEMTGTEVHELWNQLK